jgi:hypothetical protein
MKVLIVTEVTSDRLVDPAYYLPFLEKMLAFVKDRLELEMIDELSAAKEKIVAGGISAVIFLSRAMMIKAMTLGRNFPQIDFLVFCGILEQDIQKPEDNVFLIKKDAGGQTDGHFREMLDILTPGWH